MGRCVKLAWIRPGFYFPDKNAWTAIYIVIFQDRPGEIARLDKKTFEKLFMTYAPQGNERIQAIFDAMPNFERWREGLLR